MPNGSSRSKKIRRREGDVTKNGELQGNSLKDLKKRSRTRKKKKDAVTEED